MQENEPTCIISRTKAIHWAAENAAILRAARCHVKLWLVAHRIPEMKSRRSESSRTGRRPMAIARGIDTMLPTPRKREG